MAGERSIIKADQAAAATFDYKAREISVGVSDPARQYVHQGSIRSPDFKISELIANQAGISQMESEALQDKINSQVLDRLKEVQEKGYREGYELGLLDGSEKAFQENKKELMQGLEMVEKLLKRLEVLKEGLLIENEAELIRLVFLTAKKIAMRDLEEHRGAAWEILKTVAGEMQSDQKLTVSVSHEDLYFIQTLQEKSNRDMETLERVKLVSDGNVKSGGCMIQTEYGNVDATVEERVERTWNALQSRIPRVQPDTEEPK